MQVYTVKGPVLLTISYGDALSAAEPQPGYTIRKRQRNWMVIDPQGALVCLTVYRRGVEEVVQRLVP